MVLDDELNDELNIVEHDVSPNMWHKRLVGKTGVHVLTKKSLNLFAKDKDLNPCDICLLGKQSINSTPHNTKIRVMIEFFFTRNLIHVNSK